MPKKKTEAVETADLKPKVTRAKKPKEKFKGWKEVQRGDIVKYVCPNPNCGAELKEILIRANYNRCPVCGTRAE